jgi:thiol-disulfide isomerase/thioredoxin
MKSLSLLLAAVLTLSLLVSCRRESTDKRDLPNPKQEAAAAGAQTRIDEPSVWQAVEDAVKGAAKVRATSPGRDATPEDRQAFRDRSFAAHESIIKARATYYRDCPTGKHANDNLTDLSEALSIAGFMRGAYTRDEKELIEELLALDNLSPKNVVSLARTVVLTTQNTVRNARTPERSLLALADCEKRIRSLMARYPENAAWNPSLMQIADISSEVDRPRALRLLRELAAADKGRTGKLAQSRLVKLQMLGKPVDIAFNPINGGRVDLAQTKGKVVLVDFWATWCTPCVNEIPNIVKIFETYHDQGFEIVGISYDSDKKKLTKMMAEKGMSWPQYFDALGSGNQIGRKFGISGIPTMWLIDKDGNLADLNARKDLEAKVKALLEK